MKKILFILVSLILTFNVLAIEFNDGKQYITLKKPVFIVPQVVEFFSFFCPHCYQFEHVYHVTDVVKNNLPANIRLTKYHVDFLGGNLGLITTHAWAVAIALGIEDKVLEPLFYGIQKTQTIIDAESLKKTFIKATGISSEIYDAAWNSVTVKKIILQQQKAALAVDLKGVPAVFIKGKYMVKMSGLDLDHIDSFADNYAKLIRFLIKKK